MPRIALTVTFTALLLFLHHMPASAQRRWDIAPFGGIVAVNAPVEGEADGYREDWFHTGQWGVTMGWHLTTHLKLEIDAAATGTGTQFVQRFVTVPGQTGRYPVGAEAETSVRSLGAQATWQFFDNEWVHPYVFGGGAKLYVNERTFFRTEARVDAAPAHQSLSFRAGLGFDF